METKHAQMRAFMQSRSTAQASLLPDGSLLSSLPLELQDAVIARLPPNDLCALQRVSKHFHDRASRVLWGTLSLIWTGSSSSPWFMNDLVEALRALTWAKHDYARYIHQLHVLEPYHLGVGTDLQHRARYPAGNDSWRLLGIPLFLLLQKAEHLETLEWLVPVDLDDHCWKEVARKQNLHNLTLQFGASKPSPAPALLSSPDPSATGGPSYRHVAKCGTLKKLIIQELNDLDHLEDIARCLRASSTSLRHLGLSLSAGLASKAKKGNAAAPPPPPLADFDMDLDDDISTDEDAMPTQTAAQAATDEESVKKNKAALEAALARIFSIDTAAGNRDRKADALLKRNAKAVSKAKYVDAEFSKNVQLVIDRLLRQKKVSSEDHQVLAQLQPHIDEARRSHLPKRLKHSMPTKKHKSKFPSAFPPIANTINAPEWPAADAIASNSLPVYASGTPGASSSALPGFSSSGLADWMPPPSTAQPAPPTTNYAAYATQNAGPIAGDSTDSSEASDLDEQPNPPKLNSTNPANTDAGHASGDILQSAEVDDMGVDIDHPDDISGESGDEQETMQSEQRPGAPNGESGLTETVDTVPSGPTGQQLSHVKRNGDHVDGKAGTFRKGKETTGEDMRSLKEWIFDEHGLGLDTLELYLVPVKASVLGRGLQIHALKEVTLLSVGGQAPLWQLMSRTHDERGLALKSIHTDDVSASFLACVSKLKNLDCLILRRRQKKAADNTTSKDPATIEEIRRQAVQPHIDSLRILSVSNDNDSSWCLTKAFTGLLLARGNKIEELAFQAAYNQFNQIQEELASPKVLPSLVALRFLGTPPRNSGIPGSSNTSVITAPGNGEPPDSQHDAWTRDNYMTCHDVTIRSVRARKIAGDKRLRHVSIFNMLTHVSDAKLTASEPPTWLREQFDEEMAGQISKGKGKGKEREEGNIRAWAAQKGYSRHLEKHDVKTTAMAFVPLDLADNPVIFQAKVRLGKF